MIDPATTRSRVLSPIVGEDEGIVAGRASELFVGCSGCERLATAQQAHPGGVQRKQQGGIDRPGLFLQLPIAAEFSTSDGRLRRGHIRTGDSRKLLNQGNASIGFSDGAAVKQQIRTFCQGIRPTRQIALVGRQTGTVQHAGTQGGAPRLAMRNDVNRLQGLMLLEPSGNLLDAVNLPIQINHLDLRWRRGIKAILQRRTHQLLVLDHTRINEYHLVDHGAGRSLCLIAQSLLRFTLEIDADFLLVRLRRNRQQISRQEVARFQHFHHGRWLALGNHSTPPHRAVDPASPSRGAALTNQAGLGDAKIVWPSTHALALLTQFTSRRSSSFRSARLSEPTACFRAKRLSRYSNRAWEKSLRTLKYCW